MSAINLPSVCTVNNFTSAELRYTTAEGVTPWSAAIHGDGIGLHGCTFGYGDTPQEALAACIASANAHRAAKGMHTGVDEVEFIA